MTAEGTRLLCNGQTVLTVTISTYHPTASLLKPLHTTIVTAHPTSACEPITFSAVPTVTWAKHPKPLRAIMMLPTVPTMNATLHSHILHAIKNPVKCKLSDEDWGQLEQFFDDRLPHFRHHLNSNGQILRQEEYRICMLVYIKCQPHDICSLMNMSSAHVSNTRKRILFKVYGIDGKPKDLDERIRKVL